MGASPRAFPVVSLGVRLPCWLAGSQAIRKRETQNPLAVRACPRHSRECPAYVGRGGCHRGPGLQREGWSPSLCGGEGALQRHPRSEAPAWWLPLCHTPMVGPPPVSVVLARSHTCAVATVELAVGAEPVAKILGLGLSQNVSQHPEPRPLRFPARPLLGIGHKE